MLLSRLNEDTLVARAVAGDTDAFGELYRLHLDAIYRYIVVRVSNPTDAEDLVGQVFLKAWEALPGYQQRGIRFSSWLYQIAHNLVIDHYRAQKPLQPASLSDHDQLESNRAATLDQVIEAEQSAALATAVAQLPVEQQQVILLRFVRELDYTEVARVLDKSKGACRVIQHRALTALSRMLSSTLLTVLLIFALLSGGTVYASSDSLPGDSLYPLKRLRERVELAATLDDAAATRLRLAFTTTRLDEMSRLLSAHRTEDLSQAASDSAAEFAGMPASLADVSRLPVGERVAVAETLSHQATQMAALRSQAPPAAFADLDRALSAVRAAHEQALRMIDSSPRLPLITPSASPTPTPAPTTSPTPTASSAPPTPTAISSQLSISPTPTPTQVDLSESFTPTRTPPTPTALSATSRPKPVPPTNWPTPLANRATPRAKPASGATPLVDRTRPRDRPRPTDRPAPDAPAWPEATSQEPAATAPASTEASPASQPAPTGVPRPDRGPRPERPPRPARTR
jgi:RNA polymerase sigma-70 factor, ECF subfamily